MTSFHLDFPRGSARLTNLRVLHVRTKSEVQARRHEPNGGQATPNIKTPRIKVPNIDGAIGFSLMCLDVWFGRRGYLHIAFCSGRFVFWYSSPLPNSSSVCAVRCSLESHFRVLNFSQEGEGIGHHSVGDTVLALVLSLDLHESHHLPFSLRRINC